MMTNTDSGARELGARWLAWLSLTAWRDSSRDRIVIDGVLLLLVWAVVGVGWLGRVHQGWAWIVVLVVFVRLVGEVVADRRRHTPRKRTDTADIDSPGQAIKAAEEMLSVVAVGEHARCGERSARLWLTCAVYPFAALLYAASPQGNGKGMAWVQAQAARMADPADAAVWRRAAAHAGAADLRMFHWVNRVADLDPRQRASIGDAMREAVGARVGGLR